MGRSFKGAGGDMPLAPRGGHRAAATLRAGLGGTLYGERRAQRAALRPRTTARPQPGAGVAGDGPPADDGGCSRIESR